MFLAITSLGWGFNWPVTKYLLSELPPLTLRGTTGVIGAALLAVLALLQRPEFAGAARALAAAGAGGAPQVSCWMVLMGLVAAGDYLNNGHLDIVNTSFSDDYNVLFQNDGAGFFTDVSYQAGIAMSSIPFVSFADGFLDYDNDGWLDLLIVNGHVYPEVDKHPEWGTSYAERPLLYHNLKNGKFELAPAVEGTGLAVVSVGRGAAFGDIFNDGKIDVVINNMDGAPVLLRNVNQDHHHWVDLKLVGGAKSPRDAVGATVYLTAGGIRQRGDVLSGGSYLSSNDLRVHFGLGDGTDAGTAEIHWPSGKKETVRLPTSDRIYTITEQLGITGALCGGRPCADPADAGLSSSPVSPEAAH